MDDSGYLWTLIPNGVTLATLLAVAAELRPWRDRPHTSGENHRLRHRLATRLATLGLAVIAGLGAWAYAGALGDDRSDTFTPVMTGGATLVAFAVAIVALPSIWLTRVVLSPVGITGHSPWRPTQTIRWEHVARVRYQRWGGWFVVEADRETWVRVSIHLAGITEFAAAVKHHIPADRRTEAQAGWHILRRRFPEHAGLLAELEGTPVGETPGVVSPRVSAAFVGLNVVVVGVMVLAPLFYDGKLNIGTFNIPPSQLAEILSTLSFAAMPWARCLAAAWVVWSFQHPLVRLTVVVAHVALRGPITVEMNFVWAMFYTLADMVGIVALLLAGVLRGTGLVVLQRSPVRPLAPWRRFSLRSVFLLTTAIAVGIVSFRELGLSFQDGWPYLVFAAPVAIGLTCLLTPGRLTWRLVMYWLACGTVATVPFMLVDPNGIQWDYVGLWGVAAAALMVNLLLIRAAGYRLTADPRVR